LAVALASGCATSGATRRGNAAAQRGEWDAAVAYYREALLRNPKQVEVQIALERATREASNQHVARARQLEAQDQLTGAAAEYRLAIEFDPSNSLALSKALAIERLIRERAEAAMPQSRMDQMRQQAGQTSPIPRLDPRTPLPGLKFQSASIRDVLNAIGLSTGITVTYDQNMDGPLQRPFTVDLTGHSLESAFTMVLSQNTLMFKVIDARTIFVYVDNAGNRAKYEDQYQQTFYMSHGTAGDVQTILNQMLTTTTGGNRPIITINKSANAIVVRATAPMLGMIQNIIDTADKPLAEVLIDITILEVNRKRLKDLGLDLSNYAVGLTFSPEFAPTGGATFPFPTPPPPINMPNLSGAGTAGGYVTIPSAVIKFLEQDQRTRLLAKPQLRGRENSQLTLNLGDEIPVPQTTFLATATGGVPTQPQVQYQYRPIGVNLAITPKVTYQDEIILDPIVVVHNGLGAFIDIAGQSLPTFVTRNASVSMRLRDGESNLLAGLIREEDRETARSLPGILRIPILRSLFGNTNTETDQSDVIMIVTPHIIRSREITANDLKPFYVGTQNNLGAGNAATLTPPGAPPPPPLAQAGRGGGAGGATTPPTAGAPPVTAGGAASTTGSGGGVMPPATSAPPPGQTRTPGVVPVTAGGAAPAEASAQILLTVPAEDLQIGGAPYTVPISITGVSHLGAMTLTIVYDPKVIRATAVTAGTFMQQGGVNPTFVPKIDEATGRIDIAISRSGTAPGAAGTGPLAGLVFQAVGPGTSKITITGTALTPDGQPMPLQLPQAGSVMVKK
jgi:type II secretory pathway component GspD/PulD (secretin)